MFDLDNLHELGATLRKNMLRTTLTGFAVAWGVLLLILLLSAGRGFQHGIRYNVEQFGMGTSAISFSTWRTGKEYGGYPKDRYIELTPADCDYLVKLNPDLIEGAAYYTNQWSYDVQYEDRTHSTPTKAVSGEYGNMVKTHLIKGRFLSTSDDAMKRKVIVLCEQTADVLFGESISPIGKYVNLSQIPFLVVGVCKGEQGQFSPNYIPFATYSGVFAKGFSLDCTLFMNCPSVRTEEDVERLKVLLNRQLAFRKGYDPTDMEVPYVDAPVTDMKMMDKIFNGMDVFLWIIGLSTLVIGIIGVANIMQVTVNERQREIGIRKALGAKPRAIINMILTEAVVVTLFSGLIGLVAGVGLMEFVSHWVQTTGVGSRQVEGITLTLFRDPSIDLSTALLALIVMVVSGAIAGYQPARKAVRIPAVEAMRN